jgi:predicted GIY-YIG superfamily endonuclease
MSNPPQAFVDLLHDVVAFRWSVEPGDRAWREPAIQHTLEMEHSPAALAYLEVLVDYLRAFWNRVQQDPTGRGATHTSPVWDGWDEECDTVWFPQLEPLEAKLTDEEKREMETRNDGFAHFVSMDSVLRASHGYSVWWVYVVQSQQPRYGKRGNRLPGFFYVGCTTDVYRRLREHNGLYANGKPGNPKGGKYTSKRRPWRLMAVHGPYSGQSEAMKAERALKKGKRSTGRLKWSTADSKWCRGLGVGDPRVAEFNETLDQLREKARQASKE